MNCVILLCYCLYYIYSFLIILLFYSLYYSLYFYSLVVSLGREYYLALDGQQVGNRKEQARIKLLLDDYMRQSTFCLTFDSRIVGQNIGVLRVMLDNSALPIWERRQTHNPSWQSEKITVTWTESAPEAVRSACEICTEACFCHGIKHNLTILRYKLGIVRNNIRIVR